MSHPQFVECKFREADLRAYTYRNDSEPVEIGDRVAVETTRGETVVTVVGIREEPPAFDCKPILRKVEPEPEEGADTAEDGAEGEE